MIDRSEAGVSGDEFSLQGRAVKRPAILSDLLIVGTLCSVVLGIAVTVIPGINASKPIALLIFLVSVLITLFVDAVNRINLSRQQVIQHYDAITLDIAERDSRLSNHHADLAAALGLTNALSIMRDKKLASALREIISDCVRVQQVQLPGGSTNPFHGIMREQLNSFQELVHALAEGSMEQDKDGASSFRQLSVTLTRASMKMVQYEHPDWYYTAPGKRYAEHCYRVVENGGDIRRIWVQPRDVLVQEQHRALILEQVRRGITCRIVELSADVSHHLRGDFGVIDDCMLVQPLLDSMRERLSIRSSDVERARAKFVNLWEIGTDAAVYYRDAELVVAAGSGVR